ncbi:hypothetical protein [Cryptosporangium minutisporangium]|uniref:TetR family transcriptional regulator n=1 Tax=Cryptosporangium minutisporangium TaxID=113569 RepID=A0ABP6T3F4_9ACTN
MPVPVDQIRDRPSVLDGQRPGVGNATLYRHFPTRGDLLVAVYSDEAAFAPHHREAAPGAGSGRR